MMKLVRRIIYNPVMTDVYEISREILEPGVDWHLTMGVSAPIWYRFEWFKFYIQSPFKK